MSHHTPTRISESAWLIEDSQQKMTSHNPINVIGQRKPAKWDSQPNFFGVKKIFNWWRKNKIINQLNNTYKDLKICTFIWPYETFTILKSSFSAFSFFRFFCFIMSFCYFHVVLVSWNDFHNSWNDFHNLIIMEIIGNVSNSHQYQPKYVGLALMWHCPIIAPIRLVLECCNGRMSFSRGEINLHLV